jgi:hypothetical protein
MQHLYLLTRLNGSVADVDQDNIHSRLRCSDHVLGRGNKLDGGVVKLIACPPVTRLISDLIPVEQLGYFVRHVTHAASPTEITRSFAIIDNNNESTYRFPPSMN